MRYSRVLSALALLICVSAPAPPKGRDVGDAILADYAAALRKMEGFYSHIHAVGTLVKTFHKPGGDTRQTVEIEFWRDGVNQLSREVSDPGTGAAREWIEGSNAEYRFSIVRESPDRPFTIEQFVPASASGAGSVAEYPAPWKPDATFATGFPAAAYSAFDMAMSRIVSSPSFRLRRATRDEDGDVVRMDFDFKPDQDYPIVRASVLLQPSTGWGVRSYEGGFGASGQVKRSGTVEYGPPADGVPIPRRAVREHPSYKYEFAIQFVNPIEPGSAPPSRFRLSGYGLPEVGGEPAEGGWGRPAYWFLALGAALLAAAGAAIYLQSRRRQPSAR